MDEPARSGFTTVLRSTTSTTRNALEHHDRMSAHARSATACVSYAPPLSHRSEYGGRLSTTHHMLLVHDFLVFCKALVLRWSNLVTGGILMAMHWLAKNVAGESLPVWMTPSFLAAAFLFLAAFFTWREDYRAPLRPIEIKKRMRSLIGQGRTIVTTWKASLRWLNHWRAAHWMRKTQRFASAYLTIDQNRRIETPTSQSAEKALSMLLYENPSKDDLPSRDYALLEKVGGMVSRMEKIEAEIRD